jgi:hypothetical protein
MSYANVTGHRSMALDRLRNDLYADALREVVTAESVVLDLGAGLGIHGMMAARMGARRVYLVEPEDVISVAAEAVRENRLDDIVHCLRGRFDDVVIPEQVDVIVSALTGNFLLTEDLLPVLFRARDSVLKPAGVVIPRGAVMELAPVTADALFEREIAAWGRAQHGVTLHAARVYAAHSLHYRWDRGEVRYLADPLPIHRVDFRDGSYQPLHASVEFSLATDGVCHGFAGWFTMELGSRTLSTAPDGDATHWSPAFLPMDPPVALLAGDRLAVQLDRMPYGDWTWRVSSKAGAHRHSTFLSVPLSASTLSKATPDYRPSLSADGELQAFVLARSTGDATVADIATAVHEHWPRRYPTSEEAFRVVRAIVRHLA